MALNGALAGLVSITAEPLTPSPGMALVIGAIGGVIVYFSILGLDKVLKIDDPVGAISVHGTCGIWGLLAVCLTNGDASFGAQIMGIVAIFLWTFVTAGIVWTILKVTIGIRISEEEEEAGADATDIGIEAYPEFTR
jgi:Amt family ammonium transporter